MSHLIWLNTSTIRRIIAGSHALPVPSSILQNKMNTRLVVKLGLGGDELAEESGVQEIAVETDRTYASRKHRMLEMFTDRGQDRHKYGQMSDETLKLWTRVSMFITADDVSTFISGKALPVLK